MLGPRTGTTFAPHLPSYGFYCDAMNYQKISQPSPTPSAPTSYGPMSQPTSVVAPSTPYGTVPTMQIPLPQIPASFSQFYLHPQFQYTSHFTSQPTLSPQIQSRSPTTHLVQIPSTFHTSYMSGTTTPPIRPEVLLGVPQTLIVAPQSYWPTHPQSVSPIATSHRTSHHPHPHPFTPVPTPVPTAAPPPPAVSCRAATKLLH